MSGPPPIYPVGIGNSAIRPMPISLYVSDPCWQQFLFDSQEPRITSVNLKSYKGLKTEVQIDLSPAAGFGLHDIGRAYFLIDRVNGAYKIVSADPKGDCNNFWHPNEVCTDKTILAKAEDPALEKRTLERFGLKASEPVAGAD